MHAPIEWEIKPVAAVCERVTSGGTPSRRHPEFYDYGKWPWVKTKELNDGWIDNTEECITDDAVSKSSAKILPETTILMAMYGATVGKLGILRRPMACNQACCAMIVDGEKADFRYLHYQLLSHRRQFLSLAVGAAQQNLSGKLIKSFELPFPPLVEQRAIASVLGSLDDKIELNRRMNETLEEMARALFNSWFVDFDPVRAKMEGRKPVGMDDATVALFPDSFENSPQGDIPKGWRVGEMWNIASQSRVTLNPATEPDQLFYHYSIPAFDESRVPQLERGGHIKSNKFVIPENAVLLSRLNPRIPRCWLPNIRPSRQSVCSTEYIVALPKPTVTREFLFAILNSQPFVNRFQKLVTGTSGSHQRVKAESWQRMEVLIPSAEIVKQFTTFAQDLFLMAARNIEQTLTLTAIRDALLPKLLSGEIRLREAEMQVEEVL